MKITLAYFLAALLRLHPRAKLRKSDRHAPFLHVYVTVGKPMKMDRKSEDSHYI